MNTNQTIDERCAELARCGLADAQYLALRNFMPGESARHLRFCIVSFADRIIALRTVQESQSEAGSFA